MKKSVKPIFISAIIMSIALSGCAGELPQIDNDTLSEAYTDDASVYRTIYSAEVGNLNYLVSGSAVDVSICANVIDALVDYDQDGNILPGLAESWEADETMTKWTFHLRDDITWVDYEGNYYADVTADDFVAAAQYVNDAANEADAQYMYCTGSVVKNASEYYDYTSYLMNPSDYDEPVPEVKPEDIGVKALSDNTLVYELDQPCPFFPSVLSYTTYLPICRKYLKENGDMFAKDYKNMLYNGAYILHYFEPLEKRVLVKNPSYWDKDNVYIDRVESTYDPDARSVSVERYLSGVIDRAEIEPERLQEYFFDKRTMNDIHKSLPDSGYSYFYAFNYMPMFDEKYEPDNWAKAVANQNFRMAIRAALDREGALKPYEPYNPEMLLNNTITPYGAAVADGKDYTDFGELSELKEKDYYSRKDARDYKEKAVKELSEQGVTFPVKILMPYNPATTGWKEEVEIVKEQLESILGTDFIEIYIEAGSETGFLKSVRRRGKYALMKCNWGADYADPQTWSEPFEDDVQYTFWHECTDPEVTAINEEWEEIISRASSITNDDNARYEAFAEAEALLIDNCIVVPFSIMNKDGYIMDKLDPFEGEYSTYGMAPLRYKRHHLMEDSMGMDEFNERYDEWISRH